MNLSISTHRKLTLALALTGVFVASDVALAQKPNEEVIVRAPIERAEVRSSAGSIVRTETIELNRYVSFADLYLSNPTDAALLDKRIAATAKESCRKLSDMFPLDRSDPSEFKRCVKKAIARAGKHKQKAILAGH
jgi:UrcA family protein